MEGYSRQELEDAGLTDFRIFLCEVWLFLNLPKPTPIQLNIALYLQKGPKRIVIEAFRGVGKSWITVAFVLWVLLLDPQKKVLVVSAGESLASDFTKFAKQLIYGMPLLKHLQPRGEQRSRGDSFDVGPTREARDASVFCLGITGQLTGHRADLIIADDVETPKNSMTQLMRDRLAELVKEFDALLTSRGDDDPARVVYLGTPQTENSLYSRLPERGYKLRIWPAEVPASATPYKDKKTGQQYLAPVILEMMKQGVKAGTPTDPARFGTAELEERRLSYLAGYELQYMLNTAPSDANKHPLKLANLMVYDLDPRMAPVAFVWGKTPQLLINELQSGGLGDDRYYRPAYMAPEMAKYTQTVMAIDPSGKGKDETAYAILKYLHGNLFLVDSGGFVDGYGEDTMKALAARALRWGVNDIIIEKNYGGGMFDKLLQPHLIRAFKEAREQAEKEAAAAGKAPEEVRLGQIDEEWKSWATGSKENRIIDILQPVIENHRLIVARSVIEQDLPLDQYGHFKGDPSYALFFQLTRIFRAKGALVHDDRVDALSMAVAYFTDRMDRDQRKAAANVKEKLKDKALKDWMDKHRMKHHGHKKPKYVNL